MARPSESIDDILMSAVAEAMRKAGPVLQRRIAALAAAELERNLAVKNGPKVRLPVPRRSRPRGEELTRWVADRNARRVPKFVIEATGLDTKKKIVAKYGANAVFQKGKPLPKAA